MHVIHVVPTAFGEHGLLGGGERYPLELARALAAETSIELLTFGRPGVVREACGLTIRTLPVLGRLGGHPAHPVAPGLPLALSPADIIHTHHMRSFPARLAALTARALRRRLVVTDHGLQGSDWGGLLPRLYERFLLVSRYSARELQAPADRTEIIYGGADPQRYFPDPHIRRRGLLFVGRITPHKGLDRLIEALPEGIPLTIAGSEGHDSSGPERHYPRRLRESAAGKDVTFLGPVSDDRLPDLYRSASAVVLPSVERTLYGRTVRVSELLGLVLIEAMASGTPVIASRIGGIPEIVTHGETGYLVEPGNVAELRERISQLHSDAAAVQRLGNKGRERVCAELTWQACAQRCLAAYTGMMRGSPGRSGAE